MSSVSVVNSGPEEGHSTEAEPVIHDRFSGQNEVNYY